MRCFLFNAATLPSVDEMRNRMSRISFFNPHSSLSLSLFGLFFGLLLWMPTHKQQISSRTMQSLQTWEDFFLGFFFGLHGPAASPGRYWSCFHSYSGDVSHCGPILRIANARCHPQAVSTFGTVTGRFLCSNIIVSAPVLTRPRDKVKRWKDRRDEVVAAGKGEITEVEGWGFSIIQSDNMPLSWNHETLPDSLELGRLAGKRIMQDDGICHNLHCPGNIWFDRAMRGRGLVMSHGQVTEEAWQNWFLRYVHQS